VSDYLENPFLQYLSTIPHDEIEKRPDKEALLEYCDLCRIAAISKNIYSGHGGKARKAISSVTSPKFAWKKIQLRAFSLLPKSAIRLINKHAKTLSHMKHKISRVIA
jgi:hypothetical protein